MSCFFEVPGWALSLLRRVLFFWVRTTVFPERPALLPLDPDKPVCYILQHPQLSSLLVLSEETRRAAIPRADAPLRVGNFGSTRSTFFLTRKTRFTATARERHAPSHSLVALVAEAFARPELDVQLVPVLILWGRRPDKQDSILRALFSETWRNPGTFRQLLTILLHGRNVLVRFSTPISLGALSHEGLDETQGVRKLSRVLRVHFRRQREMAIGPDLSHRNTQIEAIIGSASVRQAIASEAETRSITVAEAEQHARRFALEIASDFTYGVVRALGLFLSWLWNRLYDRIAVYHLDVLTRIAPGQSIVYVPAHRSHIDYLLLSFLLHRNGFTPPHIAAGANLNLPLVGALLRRSGAFFLRRSFKGQPLYAAVFHEYLHLMMARGFPLEYFIEGGRSRSGRTLAPKAGMLAMTVRSFLRERTRPLVFIPVYLGYEKILEGRSYIRELSGKPKQKESLFGLLKIVRRIRREFGTVHVNFGEPLELSRFLDEERPGWRLENPENAAEWAREATAKAAVALSRRLNDAAVVTPVNLVALALLATPRHTIDENRLIRLLDHYLALTAEATYAPTTVSCTLDARQVIAHAKRLGFIQQVAHPMGDLIRVPDDQAPLLAYFRNNILHLVALPAIIACLLSHNRSLAIPRVHEAVAGIYSLLGAELFMHWTAGELPSITAATVERMESRALIGRDGTNRLSAPEPNTHEAAELQLIGETVRPVLERHFLVLSLLSHAGSGFHSREALENECHLLSQRLALLHDFGAHEQSEKANFSALVTQLIDAGFLDEDATGLLQFDQRIAIPLAHAELVLPADVRQLIRRTASSAPR